MHVDIYIYIYMLTRELRYTGLFTSQYIIVLRISESLTTAI